MWREPLLTKPGDLGLADSFTVRDMIFLLLLLSLMWGAGRKSLKGERGRARGEVASFWNSKSGALSQRDFGFSLCAAPKFQVLLVPNLRSHLEPIRGE